MNQNTGLEQIYKIYSELYPESQKAKLDKFLVELNKLRTRLSTREEESDWYKDATVYSLYVDLFNKNFKGLADKLDYLQDLGVSCLWLLPILDSPMKDAGFDIKDYLWPGALGLAAAAGQVTRLAALSLTAWYHAPSQHHRLAPCPGARESTPQLVP